MSKVPYPAYNFNVSFPCGPENAEKLTASALREIQKIVDNGPTATDLSKFKEAELLEYKKNIRENNFWMQNFTQSYTSGANVENILAVEQKVNALTAKDIQEVAKKYLTKDKVIGMLMPEEKK
jgi:zinc protease